MISLAALLWAVVYIVIGGLVLWLLNYLLENVPLPEPFRQVGRVILIVLGVLFLIGVLLSFVGGVAVFRP